MIIMKFTNCFFVGDNFVGMTLACFYFLITVMLIYGALMVSVYSESSFFSEFSKIFTNFCSYPNSNKSRNDGMNKH